MNTNGMFSSNSDEYETPQDLFDELNEEFHFTLDVCATPENAKCKKYFTKKIDAFKQEWKGFWFMNPPYGREIIHWVLRAKIEALAGNPGVCLLPARTDTKWWSIFYDRKNYKPKPNCEIRFLEGRLKFINRKFPSYSSNGDFKLFPAPFPSAIVIFKSC
jgi:phage N-6-adenine-methyltransferase